MNRLLLPALLVLQSAILIVVFFSPLFKIKNISCSYFNASVCPEAVMAELNKYQNQSTLFLNTSTLKSRLLSAIPESEEIIIKKSLPQSLQVAFTAQSPLLNLKIATNSAALVLSRQNRIVNQTVEPDPNLTTIIYKEAATMRVGDLVNDPVINFVSRALPLIQNIFPTSLVTVISPQEIIFKGDNGKKVIMTSIDSPTRQVTTLQLILSEDTMSSDFTVIDIRFEKPVLRRS